MLCEYGGGDVTKEVKEGFCVRTTIFSSDMLLYSDRGKINRYKKES